MLPEIDHRNTERAEETDSWLRFQKWLPKRLDWVSRTAAASATIRNLPSRESPPNQKAAPTPAHGLLSANQTPHT